MMISISKVTLYTFAFECASALALLLLSPVLQKELFVYVPVPFFLGSIILLGLLLYKWQTHTLFLPLSPLLISALVVSLLPLPALILHGHVAAQYFGFMFELTTGAALTIFFIHTFVFSRLCGDVKHLVLHIAGVAVSLSTLLLYFTGVATHITAGVLITIGYALYCANQIAADEYKVRRWVALAVALSAVLFVPLSLWVVLLTTLLLGFHCYAHSRSAIKISYFVYYTLGIVIVFAGVLSALQPERGEALYSETTPWTLTQKVLTRTFTDTSDLVVVGMGEGSGTAVVRWLEHRPQIAIEIYQGKAEPVYIGSFAITHILAGGVLSLVAWLALLFFLLQRTYALLREAVKGGIDSVSGASLYIVSVAALFFVVPSYVSLVAIAAFVGVGEDTTSSSNERDAVSVWRKVVLWGYVLCSALLLLHTHSIVSAQNDYQRALSAAVAGNTIETEQLLSESVKQRAHPVALRTRSQVRQELLREQIAADTVEPEMVKIEAGYFVSDALEAATRNSFDYENWLVLGNAYFFVYQLGADDAYDLAVESYSRAHEAAPKLPDGRYMRSQVLTAGGDYYSALGYLESFMPLYPENTKYQELHDYIQEQIRKEKDEKSENP